MEALGGGKWLPERSLGRDRRGHLASFLSGPGPEPGVLIIQLMCLFLRAGQRAVQEAVVRGGHQTVSALQAHPLPRGRDSSQVGGLCQHRRG